MIPSKSVVAFCINFENFQWCTCIDRSRAHAVRCLTDADAQVGDAMI
jgi:hypothetical protein